MIILSDAHTLERNVRYSEQEIAELRGIAYEVFDTYKNEWDRFDHLQIGFILSCLAKRLLGNHNAFLMHTSLIGDHQPPKA